MLAHVLYLPVRSYSQPLGHLSFDREIDDYNNSGNGSEFLRLQVNIDDEGWQEVNTEILHGH